MRSTKEQLDEIIKRSDAIKEKARLKRRMFNEGIISAVCLVLIVISVYGLPGAKALSGEEPSHYGSLILSGPYMGMIVVGLLAFLLGITVTLLCQHYKRYKTKGSQGDGRQ